MVLVRDVVFLGEGLWAFFRRVGAVVLIVGVGVGIG